MARAASLEAVAAESADLARILDRVLVVDDLFSGTEILLLEKWALQTPHWKLANAARDEQGRPQHRIWGASYIEAWKRNGWPGLPPVLFSAVATMFQKLGVVITRPEYIGLNGQSRGQDGSTHVDCARDAADQLSLLIYVGEDTDGALVLYDKDDPQRRTDRIGFRPNRVVAMDGSCPPAARAPSDD
ncbi:MAG TPA: hypothetical protein VGB42_04745, partial [Candidatus Thermoplasmatota archaeon]